MISFTVEKVNGTGSPILYHYFYQGIQIYVYIYMWHLLAKLCRFFVCLVVFASDFHTKFPLTIWAKLLEHPAPEVRTCVDSLRQPPLVYTLGTTLFGGSAAQYFNKFVIVVVLTTKSVSELFAEEQIFALYCLAIKKYLRNLGLVGVQLTNCYVCTSNETKFIASKYF